VKLSTIKIITLLVMLFVLDVLHFTSFNFRIEFLLIGIVLCALHLPLKRALTFCIIFGIIKDSYVGNTIPYSTILFVLTVIFFRACFKNFHSRLATKLPIAFAALAFYTLFSNFFYSNFDLLFSLQFLVFSFTAFVIVNYCTEKWLFTS